MKTVLLLASIAASLATAAVADARRIPEPMPPQPGTQAGTTKCRVTGTPLFEIRHRADGKAPTATLSVYSTGAWRYVPVDAEGRVGTTDKGCLAKADLRSVRNALKAPWKVTQSQITCRAYSQFFTQYAVHGQLKYTERLCNGQSLDAASQKSLATLTALLPKH